MQHELLMALLSWAVTLSGYPDPGVPPLVVRAPHSFFTDAVCGGREPCPAFGWYNDAHMLFIDERLNWDTSTTKGLIVHEMVHYLQHLNGKAGFACARQLSREREAYAVQDEFLTRHGTYVPPRKAQPAGMSCRARGPTIAHVPEK